MPRASNTHLGQRVIVRTAAGQVPFTVVGIVSDQQRSGTVLFVPLATMQSVLHTPGAVNWYWIQTTSGSHQLIDQTNTRIEHAVATNGLQIKTQREYIGEANDQAAYRGITTALTVLGLLIVAISMVALITTLTMAVLERTREIGILRCIGAHARDVRRIFVTEGLTIALAGWLIGIPLGFALAHAVIALVQNVQPTPSVRLPRARHPARANRHAHPRPPRHPDPPTPRRPIQARRGAPIRVERPR